MEIKEDLESSEEHVEEKGLVSMGEEESKAGNSTKMDSLNLVECKQDSGLVIFGRFVEEMVQVILVRLEKENVRFY